MILQEEIDKQIKEEITDYLYKQLAWSKEERSYFSELAVYILGKIFKRNGNGNNRTIKRI